MLFGLKAMLVLALNMALVGSLLLGRVSFHGIIHMWVHCMPVLRVNRRIWKMSFLPFQGANLTITKLPL